MVPLALAFTLYGRGDGAGAVAKVLAAETIPLVLLLLVGGAAADRFPRRTVMVSADLLRFASQSILAVLLLSGHAPLAVIMVLMALIGTGSAFYVPGRNSLVPQIVSPANLQSANALVAIAQSSAGIAGPIIAGLLVAAAGGAWAIAIDAATYAISAWMLGAMRIAGTPAPPEAGFFTQLAEGWSEFSSRVWLWAIVLQFALMHLLVIGPVVVLGSLGFAHLHHGALGWGGLSAMQGIGSIAGGLAAMRLRPQRPVRAAMLWLFAFAALPLSLGLNLPYPVMGASFLAGGFGIAMFAVNWDTTMQRLIPPDRLARVSAYDWFGSISLLPLGYLMAAPMAAALGRDGALLLAGVFTIVSTAAVLMLRDVSGLRVPA
jgi:hypothetical protein